MAGYAKIATCCYCGTRSVLTLAVTGRHELSCSACGAPLHAMKRLRKDTRPRPARELAPAARGPMPRKRKRIRKPVWRRALAEAVDAFEDIFD